MNRLFALAEAQSDFLRRAARKLREAASNATPSPWIPHEPDPDGGHGWWVWQQDKLPYYGGVFNVDKDFEVETQRFITVPGAVGEALIADSEPDEDREKHDATYIALVHPTVGTAMAAWLDDMAGHFDAWFEACERTGGDPHYLDHEHRFPLAVAAAILREEPPS